MRDRGNRRREASRAVLVTALLIGAVTATLASAAGRYSVETKTVVVAPASTQGGAARCDRGSQVSGGGFLARHLDVSDINIKEFHPTSRRSFAVVGSSFDNDADEFVAYAICDSRGTYVMRSRGGTAVSGENVAVSARCPRGSRVTGGGVEIGDPNLRIRASRPAGGRRWLAVASIGGVDETAPFRVHAICATTPGAYRTVATSAQSPAPRGGRARGVAVDLRATASCPRGTRLVGGGFGATGEDSGRFVISRPQRRGWRVLLRSVLLGREVEATAYARCWSRR